MYLIMHTHTCCRLYIYICVNICVYIYIYIYIKFPEQFGVFNECYSDKYSFKIKQNMK